MPCSEKRSSNGSVAWFTIQIAPSCCALSGSAAALQPKHFGLADEGDRRSSQVALCFQHEPTLEEVKQAYLARLLEEHGGRRAEVARILGVSERNTYRLIKKYRLMVNEDANE